MLLFGLFLFGVIFVGSTRYKSPCCYTWIGFHYYFVGIPLLQERYRYVCFTQPGRTFIEHQADRRAIELLGAKRTGNDISFATMFFIACLTAILICFHYLAELFPCECTNILDVALPCSRPTNGLYELTGLAERKIHTCNPRSSLAQRRLEIIEAIPQVKDARREKIALKLTFQAGDRFTRFRFASEINAINFHQPPCAARNLSPAAHKSPSRKAGASRVIPMGSPFA